MDASTLCRMDAAICCDDCGYDLRGLPEGTCCPECGHAPPETVRAVTAAGATVQTAGEIAWLRAVAFGLALLILCSFWSLQVAMMMRVEYNAAAAINAPCPKIWAGPMVQRQLGGQPGPWGVQAWMAALGSVVAIWLITWQRANGRDEGVLSSAGLTRWSALLGLGLAMGAMLCLSLPHGYVWGAGNEARRMLAAALILVEVPAGFFLYRYLHRLAKQMDARAARLIAPASVLVPAAALASGLFLLVPWERTDTVLIQWRAIFIAGVALMMAVGVIATLGVLRLSMIVVTAAAGTWLRRRRAARRSVTQWLDSTRQSLAAHGPRIAILIGIAMLLWATIGSAQGAFGLYPGRKGLAGDLPIVGFIGPKFSIAQLRVGGSYGWSYAYISAPVFSMLCAFWLMTVRGNGGSSWLRAATRWAPLVLTAVAVIGLEGLHNSEMRRSVLLAGLVVGAELPCTVLLYLYLATVADGLGIADLRRHLRLLAPAAAVMMLFPLAGYGLSRSLFQLHNTLAVSVIGAIYMAAGLAVTFAAATALVRLAWALMPSRPRRTDEVRLGAAALPGGSGT